MAKRILLVSETFSVLFIYDWLYFIGAGYDFVDYSGGNSNRNSAYDEIVAKVKTTTQLVSSSRGIANYETEYFHITRNQGSIQYNQNNWLTLRTSIVFADNTFVLFTPGPTTGYYTEIINQNAGHGRLSSY